MELRPAREMKTTTPHVIVTKKAPTTATVPTRLTQHTQPAAEKKVIRLIPRKPERTNRNMHDILQERSTSKGKELP